jgi:hypothetical protein
MIRKGDLTGNEPFAAVFAHENARKKAGRAILIVFQGSALIGDAF